MPRVSNGLFWRMDSARSKQVAPSKQMARSKRIGSTLSLEQSRSLSQSDRSLVMMIRDGDDGAAALLYHRYAHRVLNLVQNRMSDRLRSKTEPEDIVQSAFRSIFRGVRSGHYEAPEGAALWNLLAVIAVNKLRRHANRIFAQRRDASREITLQDRDEALGFDQRSVEILEITIRETLEQMRPLDAEVLSLRLQKFSVEEIAEQTGHSKRMVERSLQKSRARLSAVLLDDD